MTAPRRIDEDSDGGRFAVASVVMRSHRAWNRLQRRAVASYEGAQLQLLISLAAASVPVLGLDVLTAHPLGVVGMGVASWTPTLVGIAPVNSGPVDTVRAPRPAAGSH